MKTLRKFPSWLPRQFEKIVFAIFAMVWSASFTGCNPDDSIAVKYGGPDVHDTMVAKYGIPEPADSLAKPSPRSSEDTIRVKYGVMEPIDTIIVKYGVPLPPDSIKPLYGTSSVERRR